ncbi:cyclic nucleotide-binding domain-containing protein [Pseudomarimonas salicorniae]|uniref:Mechanosensitive ion channel family protein n=1 Tax=Pseudomarimonas salicorniae TaxID=2933270 RepID=A0ABT0GCV1_9GAMM|nr:mechanosensitive ion channel family protein [Lysobacter sp. CAU 1642]
MAGWLWQEEVLVGAAIALALGLGLLALKPPDRAGIRNVLVLVILFVLIDGLAALLDRAGFDRAASLCSGAALFGIGAALIRLGGNWVFRVFLPRLGFELPRIVEDLVTTALGVAWLLFWLHGIGVDLASLLTTSAVITAVLAFSMQDTLGNVLGGVVLQLDDSVKVGDWVRFGDVAGQVVDVRWRHTAVETRNRETVIIPNGWLVKNLFTVIGSRRDQRIRWRRWVWFNIEIGASPTQVQKVLEDAVRGADIPNVVPDPAPSAVLMEVGHGFARWALRYWIEDPRPDDPTDSEVRMHALAALARHRIALAVVREERLVIKENDARRAAQRADDQARRLRALGEIELFSVLSDEEREEVADALIESPFVHGDTITRQGAVAHFLYLLVDGEADVWTEAHGRRQHVVTLKSGSVVGEMGLMTGEPRRATVTARSDVLCYRLEKGALQRILNARPDLAEELSRIISRRSSELDSRAEAGAPGERRPVSAQEAIRSRIRSFFGLD